MGHSLGSLDYKVSGSAWAAFGTSALVATVATFLSVLAGTLAAYSICRFQTGGSTFAFQFLCARMFPPIAVVVPMVVLFSMLRLTDTHLGLILAYTAFTLPFSIWMIGSFIEEIPVDLEGVARVHGMGRFEAFIKVTLPFIRGGLLATARFVFILNRFPRTYSGGERQRVRSDDRSRILPEYCCSMNRCRTPMRGCG
jgi:multiple sugar transport system permease protein